MAAVGIGVLSLDRHVVTSGGLPLSYSFVRVVRRGVSCRTETSVSAELGCRSSSNLAHLYCGTRLLRKAWPAWAVNAPALTNEAARNKKTAPCRSGKPSCFPNSNGCRLHHATAVYPTRTGAHERSSLIHIQAESGAHPTPPAPTASHESSCRRHLPPEAFTGAQSWAAAWPAPPCSAARRAPCSSPPSPPLSSPETSPP